MSDIADLVRAEIEKRVAIGIERYSRPLQTNDGGDGLQDSIEECADQLFYLVKEREERKDLRARIAELEHVVRTAYSMSTTLGEYHDRKPLLELLDTALRGAK